MPQTISPEGAADSEGPNASLQLGQVGQAQQMANSLKSTNPAAYAGSQEPGAGVPSPGGSGPVSPPPDPGTGAPSQPGPPQQQKPEDPNNYFTNLSNDGGWRQRLNVWAKPEHPYLTYFANLANKDPGYKHQGTNGK